MRRVLGLMVVAMGLIAVLDTGAVAQSGMDLPVRVVGVLALLFGAWLVLPRREVRVLASVQLFVRTPSYMQMEMDLPDAREPDPPPELQSRLL